MATTDEEIGQNVARWRSQRMSQKDLADAMRARGFRWAQATVWSIEKGERPLRLSEAEDLADLLAVQVTDLLGDEDAQEARRVVGRVIESQARLRRAIVENLDAHDALTRYAETHDLTVSANELTAAASQSPEMTLMEVRDLRAENARALSSMDEPEPLRPARVRVVHDGEH